eukprot:CAMPEP_0167782056 /NCGR_PEP_ID=MMETSP0111_2-20121227/6296_1 /TAXON_ID=91324 /ORGANISM="Lotharella globosa, Strain CCCM811" /LENGTH=384 /DNA_ID=CAMNT_0007672827 /DNA_START=27 /DNA_END=1178 /DNA_ORIENTATION=-
MLNPVDDGTYGSLGESSAVVEREMDPEDTDLSSSPAQKSRRIRGHRKARVTRFGGQEEKGEGDIHISLHNTELGSSGYRLQGNLEHKDSGSNLGSDSRLEKRGSRSRLGGRQESLDTSEANFDRGMLSTKQKTRFIQKSRRALHQPTLAGTAMFQNTMLGGGMFQNTMIGDRRALDGGRRSGGVLRSLTRRSLHKKDKPKPRKISEPSLSRRSTSRVPDPLKKQKHTFMYSMLNPSSKKPQAEAYKYTVTALILIDTLMFIISTENIMKPYERLFDIEGGVVSCLFAAEWMARVYVAPQSRKYRDPVLGRLAYITSLPSLIDLIAWSPFFIRLFFWNEYPKLTYLRVFRLLRILKTESYSDACSSAWRVIRFNSEILVVAVIMC